MKFRSFLFYAGIFVFVFVFSMAGYVYGVSKISKKDIQPITAEAKAKDSDILRKNIGVDTEKLAELLKETYILRENENKVSLFIKYSNGDEHIHSEYEIAVNLLPKEDRERLKEGIEFETVDDVIKFIEDYMG